MSIIEIKKKSLELHKNQYAKSVIVSLSYSVLVILASVIPYVSVKISAEFGLNSVVIFLISALTFLLFTLLTSSYTIGEKAWYAGLSSKNKAGIRRFFFWFRPEYCLRAFCLKLVLFWVKLFWAVLLNIPGTALLFTAVLLCMTGGIEPVIFVSLLSGSLIMLVAGSAFAFIINQRYFLAEYLYVTNPRLKILQAVRQSKNLLDGHLFEVVRFKLSFAPALLLYLLVIPAIFIHPYYKQSCCLVAKELYL